MTDTSAHTPSFSRGSTVLDYWLAHAEGLTIQPSGARVEEVVARAPIGRTETLIVRSRLTRRRKEIPADAIAAVEPFPGHLMLDAPPGGAPLRLRRPSPERLAAGRAAAARGGRIAGARAVGAARITHAGSRSAISWLRPRAVRGGAAVAGQTQLAAGHAAKGISWLAPRVVAGARAAAATSLRLALATEVLVARAAAHAARSLERRTTAVADRGRASLEAQRELRRRGRDD